MRAKNKLYVLLLLVIFTYPFPWCYVSTFFPEVTPTVSPTQTVDVTATWFAFHTEMVQTMEALIASQTVTPTPTITLTPTRTTTPTIPSTFTPTATDIPTVTPMPTVEVSPQNAHQFCDDRTSMFFVANYTHSWCEPRIFDGGYLIVNYVYSKAAYGEGNSTDVLIPLAFEEGENIIIIGCDDYCYIQTFLDDAQTAFADKVVWSGDGVVNWILYLEPDKRGDGYLLVHHEDNWGSSGFSITVK